MFLASVLTAAHADVAIRPNLTLQFFSEMHAAKGYGHNGDGCLLAEAALQNKSQRVIQNIWFDYPNQRLAQSNPGLKPGPDPGITVIGLYAVNPPTELDLEQKSYGQKCFTEPIPPTYCRNGSRVCPPKFGFFGEGLTPFSSVFGDNYLNTSLLESTPTADIWQWEYVNPTLMPNRSIINVTRNYTYTVSKTPAADGTRPLLRFQWTQSIPLEPALPIHRDCFIFDHTANYTAGPIDPSRWHAPVGVTCEPREPVSGADESPRSAGLTTTTAAASPASSTTAGSLTTDIQHPATWTGDVILSINPRQNATKEYRLYEYHAAALSAKGNLSSSLMLPTQLPSGTSTGTNQTRPLSWFNGSALDLYVHEHNVLFPCADAMGKPLPWTALIYDTTRTYTVKAVYTYAAHGSGTWFACTITSE
jgi:hypothetical protein